MIKLITIAFLCFSLLVYGEAGAGGAAGAAPAAPGTPGADAPPPADAGSGFNTTEISTGIKSDLQLIFFAGVGGALMGLSTLSFVEKPSKEVNRITVGFALGTMAAAVFVLYKTTTKSMTGSGISKMTQPGSPSVGDGGMIQQDPYNQDEYEDGGEGGDGEDGEGEGDDGYYGAIENMFYLASINKKGFKLGIPLVDFGYDEKKHYMIKANLLRVSF